MLKKLNLDGTKNYELAVAASKVSQMLVDYVQGHPHTLSIGSEQGDIEKWDDLVLEEKTFTKHIQIKRQNTNFSDEPVIRNVYTRQARKGQLKDLSAFDETMKNLGEWFALNNQTSSLYSKQFEVFLPEGSILIKSDLTINSFKNLCENHIKDVTTVQGMNDLTANDRSVNNIFNWLTTWCDFKDWNHILMALRQLKIVSGGSENEIDDSTIRTLQNVFHTPQEVLSKIKRFISDNTTFTGAIKPRQIYNLVKENLQPEIQPWTQFEFSDMSWKISGTIDTELTDEIERPSIIVSSLWDNAKKGNLKIVVPDSNDSPLLNKTLHLALHLQGVSHSHIVNHAVWNQTISSKIGKTLGIDKNDCDSLAVTENGSVFSTSEVNVIDSLSKEEAIVAEIDNEIIKITWETVSSRLTNNISALPPSDLKTAIDGRWRLWYNDLNSDIEETKKLFMIMLHPTAEGKEIIGELRIGIKTANLIVDGIFLLLVVSVGLSDTHDKWNKIADKYSTTAIGLSYWSGAAGEKRNVREIDSLDGIEELIGKESSDILILSKVKSTESEIYNISLANTSTPENSLAQPHRPKLLVTKHRFLQNLIEKGDIEQLRNYLNDVLQRNENSKINSIEKASHDI